jgi:hypothetical protein
MDMKISLGGKIVVQCRECREWEEGIGTLKVVVCWSTKKREWKSWILHRGCMATWRGRGRGGMDSWLTAQGATEMEFSEFLIRLFRREAVVLTLDDDVE